VALQLLRGLEEILMKGATHNLVVRTRTDVALYVLNHKRGHLRDLENSFKVSLAVIADPTVSGQQSFVIDRAEQVHTLEAAKALLAAQVAAFPPQSEEAFDEDEAFDIEAETEVETDESEGLGEDSAGGDEANTETGTEGPRRKRRRRRRGRGGEPREGGMPHQENSFAQDAPVSADAEVAGEGDAEEDEADEQPNEEHPSQGRADHGSGERRPRRRGRRGGRRRRGGPEDGLAGSIADELGPVPAPEAASAVADFDGYSSQPSPATQPAPEAPIAEQSSADRAPQQPAAEAMDAEAQAQESEKAARRRSTVREKVSFAANTQPEHAEAAYSQPQPSASSAPAQAEPASETAKAQPRRAGWWSRRFGGGE
jgi:ribonuclease E